MNIAPVTLLLTFITLPACASGGFQSWLQDLRTEALREGVRGATLKAALAEIELLPRVIELDQKQPERTTTFAQYADRVLPLTRVSKGRALMQKHRDDLTDIADEYGVPAKVIVALWGMETSYGANTGGFDVVSALATLAYEGRRAEYFRGELMNALKILDAEHIDLHDMKGSWAGAMGQCQFMPSSFLNFAIDYNGDGRRDIWQTELDVFASAANYLHKSGWKRGETWGREVRAPRSVSEKLIGLETKKTLSEWAQLGFSRKDGSPLPAQKILASLVMPDGVGGRAFLVYDNYRVIMQWNRSTYFATSVGLLSDLIGG